MGGKKKAAKKAKKGDDDGEIDQSTLNEILTAKVQALKAKLVLEQERRDNSDANVEGIREEGSEMQEKMDGDWQKTREMVNKMTSIYKKMEKEYSEKIEHSEAKVHEQEQSKKKLKEEIGALEHAKEEMITQYDSKIFKLRERIDTMSTDFARMLKNTLKKMQDRIDDANQTYEGDQPGNNEGQLAAAAAAIFNGEDGE